MSLNKYITQIPFADLFYVSIPQTNRLILKIFSAFIHKLYSLVGRTKHSSVYTSLRNHNCYYNIFTFMNYDNEYIGELDIYK